MIATRTDCLRSEAWSELDSVITGNFQNPDMEAAKILFSSIAAHKISDSPPVWPMLIAPSGSMKTALLEGLRGLPGVHFVDEVTTNTFISGKVDTPGKTRKSPASYLHRIGGNGILIAADFGTIMSMDSRTRGVVLAQLRRIYDGKFSREFGTDENLDERNWSGRITFVAGTTPEVDNSWSVFQSLGERFIRVRWPRAGGTDTGRRAIRQHEDLAGQVQDCVKNFMLPTMNSPSAIAPLIPEELETKIVNLSEFVALSRAHVSRDRTSREIDAEPVPEGNTRLAQELVQVGRGWACLNSRSALNDDDYSLIKRAGLDCIPPIRRQAIDSLICDKSPYCLGLPSATVDRACEDLIMLKLAEKNLQKMIFTTLGKGLLTEAGFPHCATW
jgi:hypothetical protein